VPRVTIAEPELARQVLSNKFGHFQKVGFGQLQRLLHSGVSTHEGDKWARHRRIIKPAFHLDKLKGMLPAFASCCADLVRRWEGLAVGGGGGEPPSCEVDVWPEMQRLTGDVISRAAFGSSYLEGRRIFELQEEQVRLAMLIANKIHIPGYIMLPTRINRQMKRIAREIEGILRGIIAKREGAMRAGAAAGDDLLGLLLESNMEHSSGGGGGSGGGMSTEDVIGECKLFYFAGMETTSGLLTWTMVVLSMHPEWQDRAREEVLRVVGGAGTPPPDYDGLSRLKIVTMVLHEVLRLYSPLPAVHRRTYKPVELGGVRYPAGVVLALPLLCIHHDRDVWGPDADEFRPERFAEGVARASGDRPAFFPFGGGPRTCIGQNFALLEAKMGLAMILRSFEFELSPSYSHAPFSAPLLKPEHGAQVNLRKLP